MIKKTLFSILCIFFIFSCSIFKPAKKVEEKIEKETIVEEKLPQFDGWIKTYNYNKIDPKSGEFPGGRGWDEMVIYTPAYGKQTGTNEWGAEAVIRNSVVISSGGNNSEIPKDGFVISGHGKAKDWIMQFLTPGIRVSVDEKKQIVKSAKAVDTLPIEFQSILSSIEESIKYLSAKNLPQPQEEYQNLFNDAIKYYKTGESHLQKGNKKKAGPYFLQSINLIKKAFAITMPSRKDELRAVWYRLTEKNRPAIELTIKRLADAGFNAIFPETIYYGNSICLPPTDLIEQNPEYIGWDPLKDLIDCAHQNGIEVHSWVHIFFIGFKDSPLIKKHPDWVAQTKEGNFESEIEKGYYYFCPSNDEVRKALKSLYRTLVQNYNLDGFQFDYIRYSFSTPVNKSYCYCHSCREKFFEKYESDPATLDPEKTPELWEKWNAFREEQITSFVAEVSKELKSIKPNLKISVDVFPDPEEALKMKFQNWLDWCHKNYVDVVCPMIYTTDINTVAKSITKIKELIPKNIKVYAGLAPFLNIPPISLLYQIRNAQDSGADGIVFFSLNNMNDEYLEMLKYGPFREKTVTKKLNENTN